MYADIVDFGVAIKVYFYARFTFRSDVFHGILWLLVYSLMEWIKFFNRKGLRGYDLSVTL